MARMADPSIAAVERALYDDRSLVRLLAMRRTLFVVPVDYANAIEQSSAPDVAAMVRRRLETSLLDTGIADPARWLDEARKEVEQLLAEEGAQARALTPRSKALATRILMGRGTKNPVEVGATSRVLVLLAVEGHLVRGRPAGDWTDRQYVWHRRDQWLGSSSPMKTGEATEDDELEGSVELVRRWLEAFGPATFKDLKWWTGWRVGKLRQVLAEIEYADVDLDGMEGLALADDLDPVDEPEPWAALLPSLDPTPMGWNERAWYLGPHQGRLFDRNGNVGPTIWLDGRIVGGWGQRPDGTVVTELLEDVGAEALALIDARADELQRQVGETVVRPSFPTPLQKEIYQYSS